MAKPPAPTKLKLLKGETRPSRIGTGEPQPREELPEAPYWLDEDARMVWTRTVQELAAMGLALAADTEALVVFCTAVVNYARAQRALDRDGVVIEGKRGERFVKHPANSVAVSNALLIARYAREFGLTPSARVGLQTALEPADADEAAALLS